MNLKDYVASIPDFPQEGILFRDITPLMADGEAFHYACEELIDYAKKVGAQVVAGPESRGFIFGCPVAHEMKIGFVPVRKPNKLPRKTISYKYDLEYGSN
ncbi:MAG: adenine phosphoribosyltransferase, partial [Erysipelotrichaceae bacterium]|nr:adenine phosphoribosyltransferase [Erysipelotrichaceae bacterium]